MSLALYRRYRPETFAEVIGQEHVTAPLQQALRNNRVNHAYLFSGPRGCGKTTSARILARCLNCEQGPTPTPCGECQSCRDLATGGPGSIDVIEIDAASHGGVDDARELRERAFFAPVHSRYKIFILDEAHMVTSAGFNALLKVVEEPPEHLKFIFATTEPEKVIGTIRSRTHHYPFRLVPPGTLRDYLAEVCGREGIQVEDSVFPLVVRAGAGSVRDSMSVMDQLLAGAAEGGVTYKMATALLGYTDSALLDEVVDAFAAHDGATVFQVIDRVVEGGHDPRRFVTDLLERLRDLVILATVPEAGEKGLIDAPADRIAIMQAQADRFGAGELSRGADLVNTGLTEMRGNAAPRLQLELICARVMLPGAYTDELSLMARVDKLERRSAMAPAAMAMGAPVPGPAAPAAMAPQPPAAQAAAPVAPAPAPVAMPAPQQQPQQPQQYEQPQQHEQPQAAQPPQPPAPATPPPGAWPIPRSFPAPGAAPAPAAPQQAQPVAQPPKPVAPAAAAPPAPGQPAPSAQQQQGAAQVRQLWPQVLEAVKNRRRFTWILLSQNGQVAGFDGSTLQVSFINAGARDSFVSSNSDDVLRQALADALGVDWRVECIVDPSGGTQTPQAAAGAGGGGGWGAAPQAPRPAAPAATATAVGGFGAAPGAPGGPNAAPTGGPAAGAAYQGAGLPGPAVPGAMPSPSAGPGPSAAPQSQPAPAGPPPGPVRPLAPEDEDISVDDVPDARQETVSGQELIMRELGATVLEEIEHGS
ncbi:DNA polymerase III subunit gamma and tau [Kitasatospora sp. NBC_01302]|uniref:DNA polymerase III subunit gamma and tau n=1 Tax=Kitasatospora sp. NBC_01302 TaxID=2903575 RepID=UPI002E11E131|nr:DNA polymerase III subunit gamma and tau [Kitasatospora sp. NBC_01302]